MTNAIAIRVARPSDATGIIQLFEKSYEHRYPVPELRSPSTLQAHLQAGLETFFVAVRENAIIGCVSTRLINATIDPGTLEHVAEVGKLCTSPSIPSRASVARKLCRTAMAASSCRGAKAWFATLRSGPALRIATSLGFIAVGYTEEHVVGSRRERHIVALCATPEFSRRRVLPRSPPCQDSIYHEPLVRYVLERMDVRTTQVGCYPTCSFAIETGSRLDNIPVLLVPAERRVRLVDLPDWPLEYVDALVLSDKTELIQALRRRNWRLTAFLPGWYQLKYDCALVSITENIATTTDTLLSKRAEHFEKLASAALPATLSGVMNHAMGGPACVP